jgi:peptidoglycan/xylan/chitin deacetylase (PgdA/CDA1 family)
VLAQSPAVGSGVKPPIASLSRVPENAHAGALVISLDFELHWGVRDHSAVTPELTRSLVASRTMVTTLAEVFAQREVRATWATVGLLFAATAREAEALRPTLRPAYRQPELDPYAEAVGETEEQDPLHLAASLVRELVRFPGQEIASHTFSHYYCLEPGQDLDAFRADLRAAQAAAAGHGLRLRSLVLPRNQWRADFAPALLDTGFECYRGPQPGWSNRSRPGEDSDLAVRAARLASTYAGRPLATFSWDDVTEPSGLCNVPASAFLRPLDQRRRVLRPLQQGRIVKALRDAAARGRIVHLWWHPQNFVAYPEENLDLLRSLLDELDRLRSSDGMRSLSMADVCDTLRAGHRAA